MKFSDIKRGEEYYVVIKGSPYKILLLLVSSK